MKEVLILEDKEESRRILEELVKQVQPDADVYAVSSEDEAYAIAMKRTIDLFLVDIILHPETMGDQSGADFAQNLRTIEKYLFTLSFEKSFVKQPHSKGVRTAVFIPSLRKISDT